MSRRATGLVIYRLFDQEIEYLLLQTSYGKHHWTPPKGHVDPGEKDETTALRETEEESGLKESDLDIDWSFRKELRYTVQNKIPKTVVYWLAKVKNPNEATITLSSEHRDFKWLSLKDACVLADYSEMKGLLNEAQSYLTSKCQQ